MGGRLAARRAGGRTGFVVQPGGWQGGGFGEHGCLILLLHDSVDGVEEEIDLELLAVGDRFVVRPGEGIATDGQIVEVSVREGQRVKAAPFGKFASA